MKHSNIPPSIIAKYSRILTGIVFTATSVLPLATSALAQTGNPTLSIQSNITLTGNLPIGSSATYRVTIKNTTLNPAYNVKITDVLPSGFQYDKELMILTVGNITPSAGLNYVKPVATNTTNELVWDNYNIPAYGIVTLLFTAKTNSATPGTFSNVVKVDYKNSAGVSLPQITKGAGTSETADNVTIKAVPPQPTLGTATRSATAMTNTPVIMCGGKPGVDGAAMDITGIVNSYFQPALGAVAAGTSTINIINAAKGYTPTGSTSVQGINPGDLLLIVQMQDATINGANSSLYGSGSSTNEGSGFTNLGRTGLYEYAIANSTVSSATGNRTLTLKNPLINSYENKAADLTSSTPTGQKRYQVIRVPQHASIRVLGTLFASPWDGNVGGVLAVDTYGTFDLNGQRMSANSVGFRGGFGPRNAGPNAVDDYASATTATTASSGSVKGEGTAGTPRHLSTQTLTGVESGNLSPIWTGSSLTNSGEGYPGGDSGRGAPGNAGGSGNYHNSGGGGGGNGGIGGNGGLAWSNGSTNVFKDSGGRPGFLSSTDRPVPWKLIMGGGGGGGDANNSPQGVPGGAGGGIVLLRAGTIIGTGFIYANGRNGNRGEYSGSPDGAGGGGAGGTVLIQSRNATSANITIEAKGGNGGSTERDSFHNYTETPVAVTGQNSNESVGYTSDGYKFGATPHGPGGGGGGGIVMHNMGASAVVTAVLTGGSAGNTDDAAPLYPGKGGKTSHSHGATAGFDGRVEPFTNSEDPYNPLNNVTECSANLTMTMTTSTPQRIPGQLASYKMTVTNTASIGEATTVSLQNRLPSGFTYAASDSPVLTGGAVPATRSTIPAQILNPPTPPTTGTPTAAVLAQLKKPVWGTFTLPPGAKVEINFQALIDLRVGNGIYRDKADAIYPDPARTNTTQMITKSYGDDPTHNGADVKVTSSTVEMVWDFLKNTVSWSK